MYLKHTAVSVGPQEDPSLPLLPTVEFSSYQNSGLITLKGRRRRTFLCDPQVVAIVLWLVSIILSHFNRKVIKRVILVCKKGVILNNCSGCSPPDLRLCSRLHSWAACAGTLHLYFCAFDEKDMNSKRIKNDIHSKRLRKTF